MGCYYLNRRKLFTGIEPGNWPNSHNTKKEKKPVIKFG
jgi:hypothetical protein